MSKGDDNRRGIQSIEVGGQLLLALTVHGAPMMLRDLAREAGMPPAKAHPYLVSFGKLGLIEQDPLTGRYELGPLAMQMGLITLQHMDALRLATREIAALMASKPVMAFRLNKQRFRQVTQEAFDEAFRNGGKIQAEAYASGEPQETMRRFFAERAARRKARGKA